MAPGALPALLRPGMCFQGNQCTNRMGASADDWQVSVRVEVSIFNLEKYIQFPVVCGVAAMHVLACNMQCFCGSPPHAGACRPPCHSRHGYWRSCRCVLLLLTPQLRTWVLQECDWASGYICGSMTAGEGFI